MAVHLDSRGISDSKEDLRSRGPYKSKFSGMTAAEKRDAVRNRNAEYSKKNIVFGALQHDSWILAFMKLYFLKSGKPLIPKNLRIHMMALANELLEEPGTSNMDIAYIQKHIGTISFRD